MNKINTNTHNDYNISDQYFQDDGNYKRASDMRVTREIKFQIQHLIIENIFITLCKTTSEIYNFNILRIINILHHIYIENELYQLAYGSGHIYYLQT